MAVQPGAAFSSPPTVYIADHDTTPQQVVRNDTTNILIKTLQNKRAKEEAKRKQARAAGAARGGGEPAHGGWQVVVACVLAAACIPAVAVRAAVATAELALSLLPAQRPHLPLAVTNTSRPCCCPRPADKGKRPVEEAEGSRPAKRPAAAAGDGAGPSGAAGGGSSVPDPAQAGFSKLGLQMKTIKDLQNVLKAWNLTVSGKKDDLIQRILDHQQRARGG